MGSLKKVGFDSLRGALNPRTTVSAISPLEPLVRDIWVNSFDNKMYRWDGSTWIEIAGIGTTKIWTGTLTEYEAIASPDANTLYFCTDA